MLAAAFCSTARDVGAAVAPRCTARAAPGDDVQRLVDTVAAPAVICLAAGDFALRRFVAIGRDRIVLRGTGETTVLRLAAGVQGPVVVVGDWSERVPRRATAGVTIEKLRIVGAGRDGPETLPDRPYLTNSAIAVRGGRDVTIRDVSITACRSACIVTEHDARRITITHADISDAVWDGIALNRTIGARIVANTIHDDGAAGISAEHLADSFVADNVVRDNRTHGVYLSDSYRNTFTANAFVRNVLSGVFLACAVQTREPAVHCWKNSMSAGNTFIGNRFVDGRVGFMVGADSSAPCGRRGFRCNWSRRDAFVGSPREDPRAREFGRCVAYASRESYFPPSGVRLPARVAHPRTPSSAKALTQAPGTSPGVR